MDRPISLILLSALALAGLSIIRTTADPAAHDDAQLSTVKLTVPSAARVYIDPQTGKLGGPPAGKDAQALSVALQNRLSRSHEGLEKRLLPNGTLLVNLQGRFQNLSVVTVTPEGETQMTCNHSVDDVEHQLIHGTADKP